MFCTLEPSKFHVASTPRAHAALPHVGSDHSGFIYEEVSSWSISSYYLDPKHICRRCEYSILGRYLYDRVDRVCLDLRCAPTSLDGGDLGDGGGELGDEILPAVGRTGQVVGYLEDV